MGILGTLGFIANHPLNTGRRAAALMRFVRWQIGSRVAGAPVAKHFVDDTRLLVARGMAGATQNIYCGLHEFEDMAFVLHALREGDRFVDVGANVGAYTILAGGAVGAQCVAIEPIPETFRSLVDNINLNGIGHRIRALNIGVGSDRGCARFTAHQDSVNHVLADSETVDGTLLVNVERLDDILADFSPTIVKIDVEGFETQVVAGADRVLSCPSLLAVIMETNGSGDRYGFDETKLHRRMLDYGFGAFRYSPFERKLVGLQGASSTSGNTLYVRNEGEVRSRLGTSRRFRTSVGVHV